MSRSPAVEHDGEGVVIRQQPSAVGCKLEVGRTPAAIARGGAGHHGCSGGGAPRERV